MNGKVCKLIRGMFPERDKYQLAKAMYKKLNWLERTKVNKESGSKG